VWGAIGVDLDAPGARVHDRDRVQALRAPLSADLARALWDTEVEPADALTECGAFSFRWCLGGHVGTPSRCPCRDADGWWAGARPLTPGEACVPIGFRYGASGMHSVGLLPGLPLQRLPTAPGLAPTGRVSLGRDVCGAADTSVAPWFAVAYRDLVPYAVALIPGMSVPGMRMSSA